MNAGMFADVLLSNNSVEKYDFPFSLKIANITIVFKKGHENSKNNYRLVSTLRNLPKIIQQCIFRQLYDFVDESLSK